MSRVGILCCSNGQKPECKTEIDRLCVRLEEYGREVCISNHIYATNGVCSGSGKERADELMRMFRDDQIEDIYDISGGDIANEVLDYLDYDAIAKSSAIFWGYSDLTTIINAIYTMTDKASVLYQIKNIIWEKEEVQSKRYRESKLGEGPLFDIRYDMLQGESMQGIVVGGNIRCFLKLAGTKYFPDLTGKILLLEALGGEEPQIRTYLSQLRQLGAFDKVNGILLGTFCKLEENLENKSVEQLIKEYVSEKMPIAKTEDIGHKRNSKAIMIGKGL